MPNVAGTTAPSGFDNDFVTFNDPKSRLSALFTVTATVWFLPIVTVALAGVNDGVPKEYPIGAVGNVGSLTTHSYPAGTPVTIEDAPALTEREPEMLDSPLFVHW